MEATEEEEKAAPHLWPVLKKKGGGWGVGGKEYSVSAYVRLCVCGCGCVYGCRGKLHEGLLSLLSLSLSSFFLSSFSPPVPWFRV